MDKQLIAERFAKARGTYSREARVQQQVAEKMIRLVTEAIGRKTDGTENEATDGDCADTFPRHIVEFGCGTGCYSRLLLHTLHPISLLLNDLCPEMEECIRDLCRHPLVRFCAGDAESLSFPLQSDLITSCSTLQWFTAPATFFSRCHQALCNDGLLAFSTFGPENMKQIRHLTGYGLNYLSLEQLRHLLTPHFQLLHAEEEIVNLSFETPRQVLQHLKQTGVTGTQKRMWTQSILQHFCDDYIRLFGNTDGSVTLTYHPIYIIGRKRNHVL